MLTDVLVHGVRRGGKGIGGDDMTDMLQEQINSLDWSGTVRPASRARQTLEPWAWHWSLWLDIGAFGLALEPLA